jgi:hypothetical protein
MAYNKCHTKGGSKLGVYNSVVKCLPGIPKTMGESPGPLQQKKFQILLVKIIGV